jgi:2-oxoglutarate ferredoxin oxidoreductase subunit alpha
MALEFIEGNEAIARGAMKANCNFFAGYPITPSSSILHYMQGMMPPVGGVAIQAEDEIASMGFCIGAAMAGSKVLTATSGPGMSLYSENIGLAIAGETPMVIVNVQRQGPATGSATKGAEGDIQFTRWCTSGGLPVIVLSPATVEEAYELTYRAFNLSERYRVPVFLLTNKEIGVTRESVDLDAIALPSLVERARAAADEEYLPHYFEAPSDVPAFSDVGGEHIARFTTSTHDKAAYLTSDPAVIQEMIEDGADILIISYGITSRSAAVAVREARAHGTKVSALGLQTLYPVPRTALASAMHGMKKIIVPEMNMGQYILEVERLAPAEAELVGVNKMDTTLISPTEILERGGLQ